MTENVILTNLLNQYCLKDATITRILTGGNSLIYQISSVSGEQFALKIYRGDQRRCLRSLEHELEAHKVLFSAAEIPMPNLENFSITTPSILYKWIEGEQPTDLVIVRKFLTEKLISLKTLYRTTPSTKFAVDAVTCSFDIINQIQSRHDDIREIRGIPSKVANLISKSKTKILRDLPENVIFPVSTLSFSDHGIHNLIQGKSGKMFFVDFEFFGNDSISKMICDLHLHPQGIFSSEDLIQLHNILIESNDLDLTYRILLPPLALKWLFIVLRRYVDWNSKTFELDTELRGQFYEYLQYIEHVINAPDCGLSLTNYDFHRAK
jgi:hypothetical protein